MRIANGAAPVAEPGRPGRAMRFCGRTRCGGGAARERPAGRTARVSRARRQAARASGGHISANQIFASSTKASCAADSATFCG